MEIEATYIQQYDRYRNKFIYLPWLVVDGKQTQVVGKDGEDLKYYTNEYAIKAAEDAKTELLKEQP